MIMYRILTVTSHVKKRQIDLLPSERYFALTLQSMPPALSSGFTVDFLLQVTMHYKDVT